VRGNRTAGGADASGAAGGSNAALAMAGGAVSARENRS
jgi:hypothetical protein